MDGSRQPEKICQVRARSKLVYISKKLHVYRLLNALNIVARIITFYLTWNKRPYAQFYRALQDKRALHDPKKAVGGLWEEIGKLQFDFLVNEGLQPQHRLLDLGCGSLRGGLWFIRYLEPGNYYGIDISPNILEAGKHFLMEAGLENREPHLIVNHNLKFDELAGVTFNYIIAQSVFTHMPQEDIEECFRNLHKVLKPSAVFFATFNQGRKRMFSKVITGFRYPASFFQQLGEKYGYQVQVDQSFIHPRGQKMLVICTKQLNVTKIS